MTYYPPASYNPYQQYPYNSYQPQQQTQQTGGITFVLGDEAAKAQPVAPGTSGLFVDRERPKFYIKTVDSAGIPQPLRYFNYTEEFPNSTQQQQTLPEESKGYVTRDEFAKLESDVAKIQSLLEKPKGGNKDVKPSV